MFHSSKKYSVLLIASFLGSYGQSIQAPLRGAATPFEVRAPHQAYVCVSCGSCLNGVYLACCDTCLTFYRTYGCFSILPHPSGFSPCPTRSSALGKGLYTQDAGLLPAVRFYRRTSAHYRTILLQSARFGKLFRAKEHYKTLYFARFLKLVSIPRKVTFMQEQRLMFQYAHIPVFPGCSQRSHEYGIPGEYNCRQVQRLWKLRLAGQAHRLSSLAG